MEILEGIGRKKEGSFFLPRGTMLPAFFPYFHGSI